MVFCIAGWFATSSVTPQYNWLEIRDAVATSDTALTATTKDWTDRPFKALSRTIYEIPDEWNNIEIRFRGNDAAATSNYVVYLYASDDDAVKVCNGALTSGDQTATDGGFFVDTITVADVWPKDVLSGDASAGNGVSRIVFDSLGYQYIWVELTTISASDTMSVDIRGF